MHHQQHPNNMPLKYSLFKIDNTATTGTLHIDFLKLPQQATVVYLVPNIHNNLMAVFKLCDAECKVMLDKNKMVVQYNDVLVLQWW